MNLVGASYWAGHTIFTDLWQGNAKGLADYPPLAGETPEGFPIAIDSALDQCVGPSGTQMPNYLNQTCTYWTPGKCLQVCQQRGLGAATRSGQGAKLRVVLLGAINGADLFYWGHQGAEGLLVEAWQLLSENACMYHLHSLK